MTDRSDPPSDSVSPAAAHPGDFSPAQVRRILQRASEIDAHGEHASVEELLRVAREAGIDRRAMERAIAEVADGDLPIAPPPPKLPTKGPDRDTLVPSILTGAGVGAAAGLVLGFTLSSPFTVTGLAALFVFSLVRAAQLGRKGALLEFELQNLVTMGIAFVTTMPFVPGGDDDIEVIFVLLWIVTTVVGGGLVWWLGRDRPDTDDGG